MPLACGASPQCPQEEDASALVCFLCSQHDAAKRIGTLCGVQDITFLSFWWHNMNPKRKPHSYRSVGHRSPPTSAPQNPTGVAHLKPAAMGLEGPDWLADASPPAAHPSREAVVQTSMNSSPPPGSFLQDDASASQGQPRTLLEGLKIVCICKGIKKSVFWRALDAGALTKEDMHRMTGAGNGGCQGKRCGPRILALLCDRTP